MSLALSRYDFALVLIPGVLLLAALTAVYSPLSIPVALAAGSLVGALVLYEVVVREPPLD